MRAGIFSGDALLDADGERRPDDELLADVLAAPAMVGADLAGEVSTDAAYVVEPLGRTAPWTRSPRSPPSTSASRR